MSHSFLIKETISLIENLSILHTYYILIPYVLCILFLGASNRIKLLLNFSVKWFTPFPKTITLHITYDINTKLNFCPHKNMCTLLTSILSYYIKLQGVLCLMLKILIIKESMDSLFNVSFICLFKLFYLSRGVVLSYFSSP